MPVTHKEGDRYPLGPPKFYCGREKRFTRWSHKPETSGSTPVSRNQFYSAEPEQGAWAWLLTTG